MKAAMKKYAIRILFLGLGLALGLFIARVETTPVSASPAPQGLVENCTDLPIPNINSKVGRMIIEICINRASIKAVQDDMAALKGGMLTINDRMGAVEVTAQTALLEAGTALDESKKITAKVHEVEVTTYANADKIDLLATQLGAALNRIETLEQILEQQIPGGNGEPAPNN